MDCGVQYTPVPVASAFDLQAPVDARCNEWRLFHGSSSENCRAICRSNFELVRAGTGATWKKSGAASGTPLYGFGIYFAERITKADEYAVAAPLRRPEEGLHCALVSRVVGGRCQRVTGHEVQVEELRKEVFEGPYHSILGDRVSLLRKPYREIVVYDQDQCYPEYMLVYARQFD